MPTALDFQGIQIPENPELWAFRFLKILSCGHSDS